MTSQKQIEANRRNALDSTGPKAPETKAIVAKNAVKHGLRAQHTVIKGESQDEFNEFRNELIRYFNPVGFLEQLLADRFVTASWRLRRVVRIEVELYDYMQQPTCHAGLDPVSRIKQFPPTDPYNNDTQEHEPPCNLRIVKTYPAESQVKTKLNELKSTLERISRMDVSLKNISALKQYLIDLTSLNLPPESQSRLSKAIDEITEMEDSLKAQAIDDFRMEFPLGRVIHEDLKSRSALTTFQRYESSIERSLFKSLHELQRLQFARQGGPVSIPAALDINIS